MKQILQALYRRTTMISWLCAGLLAGLLLAKWKLWSGGWLVCGGMVFVWIFRRPTAMNCLIWLLIGLGAGWWRGSMVMTELAQWPRWYQKEVHIVGQVTTDPTYDTKQRRDAYLGHLQINGQSLRGTLRVHALGSAGINRGDTVRATGKLYPGFGPYQATMPFAALQVEAPTHNFLELLRHQFFAGVYNALPDPQASLGLGFLVGLKTQLPATLIAQLQVLALTHIVVASGYNLTIVVRLSRRLLARYSKFQAWAGSVAVMLAMMGITGFSASMVRAGVVSSLALCTWYFGRQVQPVLLILLSAVGTTWYNPLYIWHDLGWWLSFMAFCGVLLLSPLLHGRFAHRGPPRLWVQVLFETLAAELLVEPLIMVVFGQFSVLGLVANMVVVPLIPLAMACTLIAGLCGVVAPLWAGWAALPAKLLLSYIVTVIQWLASIPWASQKITVNAIWLAVIYCAIAGAGGWLYYRLQFRYYQQSSIVE